MTAPLWQLGPEQTKGLAAIARARDLVRLGQALTAAFPGLRERLGERMGELVALAAQRGSAQGLTHLLCLARYLACWVALGAEFETRQPWAATILGDAVRHQGAKAYQLCVRVAEQLRSAPQQAQIGTADFMQALQQLDAALVAAGTLGSLLPRQRIQLGSACDLDAVELRLIESGWRLHYTAQGGPWRRAPCAPPLDSVTVMHQAGGESAPVLPPQITLLSPALGADSVARLRVRVKAEHRCDATLHPLVQLYGRQGLHELRGDDAAQASFALQAAVPERVPPIGEELTPELWPLAMASCGIRGSGVATTELATRLAVYPAHQYLLAWRREPTQPLQWPASETAAAAAPPLPRCRLERDGRLLDAAAWQQGLQALDVKLRQGLARLFTAWERESGVSAGQMSADAAVLCGAAGITWGWEEGPAGIADLPYLRIEALFDLIACRINVRLSGRLARSGTHSQLTLTTAGEVPLQCAWQRGAAEEDLAAAAQPLQVPVRQGFALAVQPLADPQLALLSAASAVRGALVGAVGLEPRPDGPGLRWFARLSIEPVSVALRVADPLLGEQRHTQALLPAFKLVDWSLA